MTYSRLPVETIGRSMQLLLEQGMIRPEDTALIVYDLDFLAGRIGTLCTCFPAGTLHGLAIKANPLARTMEFTRNLSPDTGVEAASTGEVYLAFQAGFTPERIVFDSPVKTVAELQEVTQQGIRLNMDNLSEVERMAGILNQSGRVSYPSSIGLRINPQVGVGSILESSVAGEYSKFGVPIRRREDIEGVFLRHPWLNGVHLHIGSQGCPVEMLVEGVGILYDLMLDINRKRRELKMPPVEVFDIGGGLPVSYHPSSRYPSMEDYAARLAARAPMLFDPQRFRLITEFGRWTYTNAGWTVSRVEYVKHDPGISTAMIHVGADLFLRECLNPIDWGHEFSVFDAMGRLKTGRHEQLWNLAGPLCFSGDILARNISLPPIEEGDYVVIHDTGGYTFSMWSRYNSRQTPRILGIRHNRAEILKERETVEQIAAFWR